MTYLSFPNCLRLCKKEHGELLVRVLGEISHNNLIINIMSAVENIAEFCLQDESAVVSFQFLVPVV